MRIKIFSAAALSLGVTACTPETSKIKQDGYTYTLTKTTTSPFVGLEAFEGGWSTGTSIVYAFTKQGYAASEIKTYSMINRVTGMPSGRSVPLSRKFTASADEADYKTKLDLACRLSKQILLAPPSSDTPNAGIFSKEFCP
jgi:hypothetical protein